MNWKLWIAQGFGIGRIPVAPGTFGSVLGIALFAALLCTRSWPIVIGVSILAVPISIWLCGQAEQILGKRDPGSVVLDEIVAMPFCFCWWCILDHTFFKSGLAPDPRLVLHWPTLLVFGLFRLFDVWKPWPVRQSQSFPSGWGVTIDDLLAAVYVNITMLVGFLVVFHVLAGPK